jgi:hypothetical protein
MAAGALLLAGLAGLLLAPAAAQQLSFSAGFSDDAVLQRSVDAGAAVYGFAAGAGAVEVAVDGTSGGGAAVSYSVAAVVTPWTSTSGCNATACIDPKTPLPPPHGKFVWRALLQPQPAGGGAFTIVVKASAGHAAPPNSTLMLRRVTYGDVYFCSGQSNMALETYFTFSADTLQAEIRAGKYSGLRHFMMGSMGDHYEALAEQWVTSQNSLSAGTEYAWHNVTASAALPSLDRATQQHSAWAQFSATVRPRPGRLRALRVAHCKSSSHGAFAWARAQGASRPKT